MIATSRPKPDPRQAGLYCLLIRADHQPPQPFTISSPSLGSSSLVVSCMWTPNRHTPTILTQSLHSSTFALFHRPFPLLFFTETSIFASTQLCGRTNFTARPQPDGRIGTKNREIESLSSTISLSLTTATRSNGDVVYFSMLARSAPRSKRRYRQFLGGTVEHGVFGNGRGWSW